MKILILYLSHDGQTQKIARFIQAQLAPHAECDCRSLLEPITPEQLAGYDRLILGASIRYGKFPPALQAFVRTHADLLNQKTSAFYGVNLTARKAGKDSPETNVYVRKFLAQSPWQPTHAAVFAGALLYPRYRFFDRVMIQLIMRLTQGETDKTKEIEYTDWQKVADFSKKMRESSL